VSSTVCRPDQALLPFRLQALRHAPGHVVVRLPVQAVTLVVGDRQRFAAQGELHLQQVPGAVAQELQFPPVREGGGAEVA